MNPKTKRDIEMILTFAVIVFVALLIGNFIVEKEIAYINGITDFCEGKDGIYNISITYHGYDIEFQDVNCTDVNENGVIVINEWR